MISKGKLQYLKSIYSYREVIERRLKALRALGSEVIYPTVSLTTVYDEEKVGRVVKAMTNIVRAQLQPEDFDTFAIARKGKRYYQSLVERGELPATTNPLQTLGADFDG